MVIKRKFSSGFQSVGVSESKAKKREKGIWQRRFWEHYIRDEDDWRRHMNYIHYNPVKHGYVSKPEDWQHGSYERAVQKGFHDDSGFSKKDTAEFHSVGWAKVEPCPSNTYFAKE